MKNYKYTNGTKPFSVTPISMPLGIFDAWVSVTPDGNLIVHNSNNLRAISSTPDVAGKIPAYNLVEIKPYDHIKINDPVWVHREGDPVSAGHFAGVNTHGSPMVWRDGKTNHTTLDIEVADHVELSLPAPMPMPPPPTPMPGPPRPRYKWRF
jgi:hypothetical protein